MRFLLILGLVVLSAPPARAGGAAPSSRDQAREAPPAPRTIPAKLGEEFRLKKGEIASLEGGRVLVRIVKFINSPCPKGVYCVWSGQAVITELTVDGKVLKASAEDSPYDVLVKDSDYRTFAVLVVEESARVPPR